MIAANYEKTFLLALEDVEKGLGCRNELSM
jgi:hypothetical protein